MRCEVIAVGTELLLGQIVDTNSSWIGEQLALAGIDTHYQTKVGDNTDRIAASIELALSRSDAIIMCGGLGPTQDDITRDVIAAVMGVELVRDDMIAERIRAMFETRGRKMPQNNLRQADVPEGVSTIAQMPGTAPGLVCPVGDQVIYAVPGVPSEMRTMMKGTIIPDLQARSGETAVIGSRVLRTWGHSESGLAEMLGPRIAELDEGGHATLAFLASGAEGLKVRVTAKAEDDAALLAILDAEEILLRDVLGDLVFGLDDDTMESVTLQLLADKDMTLGVFEQATGGYLSSRLAGQAASDTVFLGSLIAGNPALADRLIGGGPADPEEAADLYAEAARSQLGADVGLAVGAATPGDRGGLNVAVAWVMGDRGKSWSLSLPGDLDRMRQFSGISLLNDLRLHLT